MQINMILLYGSDQQAICINDNNKIKDVDNNMQVAIYLYTKFIFLLVNLA